MELSGPTRCQSKRITNDSQFDFGVRMIKEFQKTCRGQRLINGSVKSPESKSTMLLFFTKIYMCKKAEFFTKMHVVKKQLFYRCIFFVKKVDLFYSN